MIQAAVAAIDRDLEPQEQAVLERIQAVLSA
jgi:tellurite resistance protein